ncbi:hypothetical protein F5887DRAFT_919124 [Amanita rubescens]|nr:hypothetical protein F5887DRAFT_919124 [Amanita rubescens]
MTAARHAASDPVPTGVDSSALSSTILNSGALEESMTRWPHAARVRQSSNGWNPHIDCSGNCLYQYITTWQGNSHHHGRLESQADSQSHGYRNIHIRISICLRFQVYPVASMSSCTTIAANPDVSGIGIRVNLYMTMLLMALIPEIPGVTTPLLDVIANGAGISGVALLTTAMVETVKGQLSLYHAIFIIHMLYFTGVMVAPSGGYKGTMSTLTIRAVVTIGLTYGCIMLFTGYAFYIWAKAPTFGRFSECNDEIKYIFFFHPVRATAIWLRKLWMAILGISLAFLVVFPVMGLCCSMCGCYWTIQRTNRGPVTITDVISAYISQLAKPLTVVYGVVMLELYEKLNKHLLSSGEQQWTFRQIMALVQIISTVNEVFHFLMSLYAPR